MIVIGQRRGPFSPEAKIVPLEPRLIRAISALRHPGAAGTLGAHSRTMKRVPCTAALAGLFLAFSLPVGLAAGAPSLVAVMGAFPTEMEALRAEFGIDAKDSAFAVTVLHGVRFEQGVVDGHAIVVFQAGASLVNASSSLQMALDHFPITHVLFGGIAGGIDPSLEVGDVVIPERWAYHSEAAYLNEDGRGGYVPLSFDPRPLGEHFGMMFPRAVHVVRDGSDKPVEMASFPVDAGMLAAARRAVGRMPALTRLGRTIRVSVGGTGVSGTVLASNAGYRDYVYRVWQARCLDMESTAYAQVCWMNGKPLVVVRGLSDLAGGQKGQSLSDPKGMPAVFSNTARVVHAVLDELPTDMP